MSANLRIYEDYLYYLPEKERKATEEALFVEDENNEGPEEKDFSSGRMEKGRRTSSLIKQLNRRKPETTVNY